MFAGRIALLIGATFLVRGLQAGETSGGTTAVARAGADLRAVDPLLGGTNEVRIGTNTVSLAGATNMVTRLGGESDFVAVHGMVEKDAEFAGKSPLLDRLVRAGVPLLVVEEDGQYVWRGDVPDDGVRTATIGLDQLRSLRRLWDGDSAAKPGDGATVRTSILWDNTDGDYGVGQVSVGLFGRRIWLTHEYRPDDESNSSGILFKVTW